ncbi:MAG TPA: SDR family oxidoreductase [Ktedonobacterales bacterium]|nr:SDR family oxidoreductase [Ktedonobacterales bacterium]
MQPLAITNPQSLAGRVALITGVSRRVGIGFADAVRLAQLGADLFVHSWSPFDAGQPWGAEVSGVDALLTELRATGRRVERLAADFRAPETPARVVHAAVDALGHIDILIANHAYSTQGGLEELTADEIDAHLLVNVRGSLLLAKEFAVQHDDSRPGGRIILMTSGQHLGPMPDELAYAASKGALHQITKSLARHLAPRHITVNTIDPGPTDTGWASPEAYQWVLDHEPMGRWGQPDDTARLIAWLATDDAQWITGQVITSAGAFQ